MEAVSPHQQQPLRITAAFEASKRDDVLVKVAARNGTTYVVSLGELRGAEYLKLPPGSVIGLADTAIQCADDGPEPSRELVTYPWSYR
ncbi:MAG: hypothetical protein P4L67_02185, partial [Candidatus Pacebacteria bacterium]|nr:hypothetical protein [Candidatus Paceibacterota bacterium]